MEHSVEDWYQKGRFQWHTIISAAMWRGHGDRFDDWNTAVKKNVNAAGRQRAKCIPMSDRITAKRTVRHYFFDFHQHYCIDCNSRREEYRVTSSVCYGNVKPIYILLSFTNGRMLQNGHDSKHFQHCNPFFSIPSISMPDGRQLSCFAFKLSSLRDLRCLARPKHT